MNEFLIIFILFSLTKCETQFEEVTGHDPNDGKNGYAGSKGKAITAFYLKGERQYRVHYKGDDKNSWTGEYCCSDPVGIGRSIDAISISGGYQYRIRYKNGNWEKPVNGYDINDSKNGYAGTIGKEIDAILIEGGEEYRVAYGGDSSNVEEVSKRVVKQLFGIDMSYSFDEEKTIIDNYYTKVTVKLEHKYEYKFKSKINLVIKNNEAVDVNLGDFGNIIEEIKKVIDFDFENLKSKITLSYSNGMSNGEVNIFFYLFMKKLQISAGSKITKDHHSYRGGFTITIYFKDHFDELGEKVIEPYAVFLKRLGSVGDSVIATIKAIINNTIIIIEEVINIIAKNMPSLLSSALGFTLFFVLSLVIA